MEHNTDRILWTVLILAIGVALYVGFRPAIANQAQTVVQTIDNLNGGDSSSNSDFIYSNPDIANDTISITGYKGKSVNLTIPTYRKIGSVDYKVTAIGSAAFKNNLSLEQVTIPDGVQTIGNDAFNNDSNLKSLILGSGVTSIGDASFSNNMALTRVDIPDSVKSIGNFAFDNDSNLKSLTLGSGVKSIGAYAFPFTALTKVDFPASLTTIGQSAFIDDPLSSISFKSPVNLCNQSFTNTKLTNVVLPTGSTYIDSNYPTFDSNVNVTVK